MTSGQANVIQFLVEFVSDSGDWIELMRVYENHGFNPQEVASAFNQVSKLAGVSDRLTSEDCEV